MEIGNKFVVVQLPRESGQEIILFKSPDEWRNRIKTGKKWWVRQLPKNVRARAPDIFSYCNGNKTFHTNIVNSSTYQSRKTLSGEYKNMRRYFILSLHKSRIADPDWLRISIWICKVLNVLNLLFLPYSLTKSCWLASIFHWD